MKSGLYTRTGDAGLTSLVDGSRVRKDSLRLDAYGTVDEFSSFLGLVSSSKSCPDEVKDQLYAIQSLLFDLGAYLATPSNPTENIELGFLEEAVKQMESWIDALDEKTPKIKNFILPGGSELSAHCHVARTVCRRAERRILALSSQEFVDPQVLSYFNRLSDYLFILARYINFKLDIEEIVWRPVSKS